MREAFMLQICSSQDAAGKVGAQVNFQFSAFLALDMQCNEANIRPPDCILYTTKLSAMNEHTRKMHHISDFQTDSWGNGIVGSFIAQNPIILDRITNAGAHTRIEKGTNKNANQGKSFEATEILKLRDYSNYDELYLSKYSWKIQTTVEARHSQIW